MKKYQQFILEKRENIVESLLKKTVKNGATQAEESSSYQKAIEIIKKDSIDTSKLNIDDEDVLNKLKQDIQEWKDNKSFSEYTNQEFYRWVNDNNKKIVEVGNKLEEKLKEFKELDNRYDSGVYEDGEGGFEKYEDGGWKYWDTTEPNGNKFVIYEFSFYPPRNLESYKDFVDQMVKFKNFVGIGDADVSNYNQHANWILRLKLTLDDLFRNMDKLGIT